jgi:hypothetical protein
MASKTKKAKNIRNWKTKPNKSNLKANRRRIQKNAEILDRLAAEDRK